MPRASSIRADRPLTDGSEDLLRFQPLADAVARRLAVSADGGLLVAVHAATPGAGRSSFLALLQRSLLERGVSCLRLAGPAGLDAVAAHRGVAAPGGLPRPVILIDDVAPSTAPELARLATSEPDGPALVVAWQVEPAPPRAAPLATPRAVPRDMPSAAPLDMPSAAPLDVELPRWDERAGEALAARLGLEADERGRLLVALAKAASPREAWRTAERFLLQRERGVEPERARDSEPERERGVERERERGVERERERGVERERERGVERERERGVERERERGVEPERERGVERERERGVERERERGVEPERERGVASLEARRERCAALAARGDEAAIAELVRHLADPHASVRLAAGHALVQRGDRGAAPAVRPLLAASDPAVRRGAAFVVGRLRDREALPALVTLLEDASAETRRAAAAALGRLGDLEALPALARVLGDDHAGVRMAAETAAARLVQAQPAEDFDALLEHAEPAVRSGALAIAARLGVGSTATLARIAARGDEGSREAIALLARRADRQAAPDLVRVAGGCANDPSRTSLASDALAALATVHGTSVDEALLRELASDERDVADLAASLLAARESAVDALAPLLDDEDALLRSRAVRALGLSGDPRAVELLLDAHARGAPEERREAATGLARLRHGERRAGAARS